MLAKCQLGQLTTLLLLALASCNTLTELSSEETDAMIRAAREKVGRQLSSLDDSARQFISSARPRLSYYRMAGSFVQYFISWTLPSGRIVRVFGQDQATSLDGATVALYERDPVTRKYRVIEQHTQPGHLQ